ncbi:hypothetical protein B0H14DRAFT_1077331 [Mycena olivaceomarginata]|nr:hypothetical protein B0H14DRAFT_1077331 [Mycena olivaceomarginata]
MWCGGACGGRGGLEVSGPVDVGCGRCGMWPPRQVKDTMRTAHPARVGTARPAFVLFPQSSRVHREDIRTSTAACAEPFASLLSSSVSPSHSSSLTPRLHTVLIARHRNLYKFIDPGHASSFFLLMYVYCWAVDYNASRGLRTGSREQGRCLLALPRICGF